MAQVACTYLPAARRHTLTSPLPMALSVACRRLSEFSINKFSFYFRREKIAGSFSSICQRQVCVNFAYCSNLGLRGLATQGGEGQVLFSEIQIGRSFERFTESESEFIQY